MSAFPRACSSGSRSTPSVDDLATWVDGVFEGYWLRDRFAWYDFRGIADDDGLPLPPGVHHLLVRVRGGQYATGGFFARVVREP